MSSDEAATTGAGSIADRQRMSILGHAMAVEKSNGDKKFGRSERKLFELMVGQLSEADIQVGDA